MTTSQRNDSMTDTPGRVAVVGAGAMGTGIAQLAATRGHTVSLVDVEASLVDRALSRMRTSLQRLHAKGRLTEPPDAVLARIHPIADPQGALPHAADVRVAIEAVPEDMDLKSRVLRALEAALPADALVATNTSGLPVDELGAVLARPGRFLAIHFFNPVALMRVAEVARAPATSDLAYDLALGFVRGLGLEPVPVRRALPGFVLNRIAMTASNEAIRLLEQGVASAEDIDRGVTGAFGWKMGPLKTADLVGLDVVLAAREQIFERTGDERFRPPDLLRRLVSEGKLGRKSGEGFYAYR